MSRKDTIDYRMVIDWELLRKQKDWLVKQEHCDEVEGILSVLDFLQDDACRQGIPEDVIWGGEPDPE